jgi:hypothetical protein
MEQWCSDCGVLFVRSLGSSTSSFPPIKFTVPLERSGLILLSGRIQGEGTSRTAGAVGEEVPWRLAPAPVSSQVADELFSGRAQGRGKREKGERREKDINGLVFKSVFLKFSKENLKNFKYEGFTEFENLQLSF